jgi:capsular polysaccharide transport system permease protein
MLNSSAKVTPRLQRDAENSTPAKEPGKAQPHEASSRLSAVRAPKSEFRTLDSSAKVTPGLRRDAENNTPAKEKGPSVATRADSRDRAEQQAELRDEHPVPQPRSKPSILRAAPRAGESIALPGRRQPWFGSAVLFVLIVLLPFAGFAYYLFFIASPRYVAEFRFSVTQVAAPNGPLPPAITSSGAASSMTSLASSLAGAGAAAGAGTGSVSTATPQNFIVTDYLTSSQAVNDLTARIGLPKLYERHDIDWWSRLKDNATPEETQGYWQDRISTDFDMITGLATARVVAFRPEDALTIASELMKLSEELLNNIVQRAQDDVVKFAQQDVTQAQNDLDVARKALADYRDREGVVDPTQGVVPVNLNVSTTVEATLAQAEATLEAMRKQQLDSSSVIVQKQIATVAATRDQLKALEREVGQSRESRAVLTHVVAEYEALDLKRQYAQALLLNAYQALDRAKASAMAQGLYLSPYVRPSLPVTATGLNKREALLIAAAVLAGIWIAVVMVYRAIRHGLAGAGAPAAVARMM